MGTPYPQGTPTPPPSGPAPVPAPSAIDVDEMMRQYQQSQTSEGINRDLLRELNEALGLGLDLPVTLGELSDAAEIVAQLRQQLAIAEMLGYDQDTISSELSTLFSNPLFGGQMTGVYPQEFVEDIIRRNTGNFDQIRGMLAKAEENLMGLAASYRGGSGSQTISAILRPPRPQIDQLPTAEEFTGQFGNAFAMYLAEVGPKVGPIGRAYLEEQRETIYQSYLNALGNFARYGVSPFELKEVDRLSQPGVGAGEAAAKAALEGALGPGVKEPTTISGTLQSVAEQADQLGTGIPREFIAVPRVDPLSFLRGTLTSEVISARAQGPTDRTVRQGQLERGGFVGQPQRVS